MSVSTIGVIKARVIREGVDVDKGYYCIFQQLVPTAKVEELIYFSIEDHQYTVCHTEKDGDDHRYYSNPLKGKNSIQLNLDKEALLYFHLKGL